MWDMSPANYRDWKRQSTSFEAMGAYQTRSLNLVGSGEPQRLDGASVTTEMFSLLGVQPMLGRAFLPKTIVRRPMTAVLWYSATVYGSASSAAIRMFLAARSSWTQVPYTVAGVMPKDFYFPNRDARFWTALRFAPDAFDDRTDTYIYGIARLKRGVPWSKPALKFAALRRNWNGATPKNSPTSALP